MTKSKTFCTEPYKQVHFDSRGNLGPCCQYIGNRDHGIDNIDDYVSSKWLDSIKKSLDNGEKIPGCNICWKQEDQETESMRERRVKYYNKKKSNLDNIEHIMITFGNQCNTACRICNVSRSSLVEKQYKNMIDTVEYTDLKKVMEKKFEWNKTKIWYKNITDSIVNKADVINKLEISGGEPFINVHFDNLIDKLISSEKELPILSVTTNGSFSENQIKKLQNFDHCHINFSIDGVGKKHYEHLRWPLKWEDTVKSVDILKKYPWLSCKFIVVPHNLNIDNLYDSIDWFKSYTGDVERFQIGFSWLNGTMWYSLQNSPKELRLKEADKLENIISKYKFYSNEIQNIEELINLLRQDKEVVQLEMFKHHVNMTDKWRGTDTWNFLGWTIDNI